MSRALPPEVVDDVVVPLPVGEVAIEGFLDGRIDPERAPDRGDANVVPIKLGDHLRRSQVANADTGERRIDKVRNEPAISWPGTPETLTSSSLTSTETIFNLGLTSRPARVGVRSCAGRCEGRERPR